ncbi:MAG: sulfatase, partial [Thermoanaerobaculia bacterium]
MISLTALAFLPSCRTVEEDQGSGINLVELTAAGEAEWSGLQVEPAEAPKGLAVVPAAGDEIAGWTGQLEMRQGEGVSDTRMVVAAPAGTTLSFDLEVPPDPVLRLGLGYQPPAEDGGEITYRVAMSGPDGLPEVLLEETVAVVQQSTWQDRAIDLERFAGQRVTLELRTSSSVDSLWAGWSAPEVATRSRQASRPNVLLISLDTLRADSLGCYGYELPTSPNIDGLAARSTLFRHAVSQAPWTRPSHMAMFTGVFPTSRSRSDPPLLSELLWRSGYRTGAFTGGGQVHPSLGFGPGFERYEVIDWLRQPEVVESWWKADDGRPRFAFLHTFEIHDPYSDDRFTSGLESGRIEGHFGRWKWERLKKQGGLNEEEKRFARALYDGGIAFTDERLGALLDNLAALGLFEDTIIILTSDHGEQFWEHGTWRHGQVLYDHQLLVPLVVYTPPTVRQALGDNPVLAGGDVEAQVSLVDILPTLLDILDIADVESLVNGRSIRPLLEGKRLDRREAFAENTNIRAAERKALRTERYKYIHQYPREGKGDHLEESVQLFDLTNDPREKTDIADEHPDLVAGFERRLQAIVRGTDVTVSPDEVPEEIDEELREQLRAL